MEYNPYEILQLPPDATIQQIKERYRHLSLHLHPDKQPIANYQTANQYFLEIDEAYKIITKPLRRFVFKEFGPNGIQILDQFSHEFSEFEGKDILNEPETQSQIRELILFLMNKQYAENEGQNKSLKAMSVLIVWLPWRKLHVPVLERCNFSYEMPLPPVYGCYQMIKVSQSSMNLHGDIQSTLQLGFSLSKFINNSLSLALNVSHSVEATELNLNFVWMKKSKLQFSFAPINIKNREFQSPEFGVNYYEENIGFGAKANFSQINLDITSMDQSKRNQKSIKFGFDRDGSVKVGPTYEKKLSKNVTLFAQLLATPQKDSLSLTAFYGYRLTLSKSLGLIAEFGSYLDFVQNSRLQVRIITQAYTAEFPILTKANMIEFELVKMGVFLGTYLLYQVWEKIRLKARKNQNALYHQSYNRLSNDKYTISKINEEKEFQATQSREKEMQLQGLVIVSAYYGSKDRIETLEKKYSQIIAQYKELHPQNVLTNDRLQFFTEKEALLREGEEEELRRQFFKITSVVQANVVGGQLFNLKINSLNVNPCLEESEVPCTLIVFWNRGEFGIKTFQNEEVIKIGEINYKKKKNFFWRGVEAVVTYLEGHS